MLYGILQCEASSVNSRTVRLFFLFCFFFLSSPRSTECVYAASEVSSELFYTLIGLFWWQFTRRICCRHIFFERSSSLLTCPLYILAVRNPQCKGELHGWILKDNDLNLFVNLFFFKTSLALLLESQVLVW